MVIELRAAASEDYDFVRRVHHRTMQGYVEDFFGSWDQDYQDQRFAKRYKIEETWILVRGGTDAGWLAKRNLPQEIFLTEFYIAPEHQNRGTGTQVLRDLIADARQKTKTVSLGVMKNNPARRLYEREGFKVIGENDYKFLMKFDAQGDAT